VKIVRTLLCTLSALGALSGLSAPRCGAAVYHSNGSAANVQLIHNTQAVDGDTITLPAGTFSWTASVRISKGITLIGQTTTNPVGRAANDQTIILVNTGANGNTPLLVVASSAGKTYRVSGITFRTGRTGVINSNGMLIIAGTSQAVRLDHCHFDDLVYENNYVAIYQAVFGVIDHNLFDFRSPGNSRQAIHVSHDAFAGRSYGDGSWAEPAYYGSEKFIFIEDNCFNNTSGTEFGGVIDGWRGGRYVYRYNHVYDARATNHGTEIGRERGFRCMEVYNNDFHWTIPPSSVGGTRSGGLITHDNTHDGVQPQRGATLGSYRVFIKFPIWGGASGDNPWDSNDPQLYQSGTCTSGSDATHVVDATKNWTPNQWIGFTVKRLSDNQVAIILSNTSNTLNVYYHDGYGGGAVWQAGDQYQIHKVLRALDQAGKGAGDLITGDNPINSTTGTRAWPHQALEPCYSWNDIYIPTGAHVNIGLAIGAFAVLTEGRDFYNNTPMPGYTPYVYPHPLVTNQPLPNPPPPPSATPCSQLQQRLDRLQRRQQRLQRLHRSNKKLNRRIRRLQRQLQGCL
jgi:hypothetical protein